MANGDDFLGGGASGAANSSKKRDWKGGAKAAGRSLSSSGDSMISDSRDEAAYKIGAVSYRTGGKVRKAKRRRGAR